MKRLIDIFTLDCSLNGEVIDVPWPYDLIYEDEDECIKDGTNLKREFPEYEVSILYGEKRDTETGEIDGEIQFSIPIQL